MSRLGILSLVTLAAACDVTGVIHDSVTVPPGWVDLVGDVPSANFDGVPEKVVQLARSGKCARAAVSPDRDAVFAVLDQGPLGYLSDRMLDGIQKGLSAGAIVEDKRITRVRLRRVGRLVVRAPGDVETTSLIYVVQGTDTTVGLVYSAPTSNFEKYRDTFEASAAQSIRDIDPAWWSLSRGEALVGGWAALFGVMGYLRWQKQRREAQAGEDDEDDEDDQD